MPSAPSLVDRTRLRADPVRNFKFQVQMFHSDATLSPPDRGDGVHGGRGHRHEHRHGPVPRGRLEHQPAQAARSDGLRSADAAAPACSTPSRACGTSPSRCSRSSGARAPSAWARSSATTWRSECSTTRSPTDPLRVRTGDINGSRPRLRLLQLLDRQHRLQQPQRDGERRPRAPDAGPPRGLRRVLRSAGRREPEALDAAIDR